MSADLPAGIDVDVDADEDDHDLLAVKAALVRLHDQQRDELRSFVEGFEDRTALIEWLHDFQLVTLGRVDEDVYQDLGTRTMPLVVCLRPPERHKVRPRTTITPAEAEDTRRDIAAACLRPACRDALRDLRHTAVQHVEEGESGPDPDRSPFTAMRPILDEYHTRQERLLTDLLDGFDGRMVLDEWLHDLDLGTYGEVEDVYDDLDHRVATRRTLQRALLGRIDNAKRTRATLAAKVLLPAFNSATRALAKAADESTAQQRRDLSAPPG